MAKNQLPENIPDDRLDSHRRELEQKIGAACVPIYWAIGLLVVIAVAVFSHFAAQIGKIESLQERITRLETRFDENRQTQPTKKSN